jgi:hypothetical protein
MLDSTHQNFLPRSGPPQGLANIGASRSGEAIRSANGAQAREILFPGFCVDCRLLGVVYAEQSEKGKTYRNDRLLAVSIKDPDAPKALDELERNFIGGVERFFASYHEAISSKFSG